MNTLSFCVFFIFKIGCHASVIKAGLTPRNIVRINDKQPHRIEYLCLRRVLCLASLPFRSAIAKPYPLKYDDLLVRLT